LWDDSIEWLPDGSAIIVREIVKAMDGDDFEYYPDGEGEPEEVEGVGPQEVTYYLQFFQYSEAFGLPHGRGWVNELPWVPDFLAFMKQRKSEVEIWRMRNPAKD